MRVVVLMCLMFVIIFLKKMLQRTNTKGFEDKSYLGNKLPVHRYVI